MNNSALFIVRNVRCVISRRGPFNLVGGFIFLRNLHWVALGFSRVLNTHTIICWSNLFKQRLGEERFSMRKGNTRTDIRGRRKGKKRLNRGVSYPSAKFRRGAPVSPISCFSVLLLFLLTPPLLFWLSVADVAFDSYDHNPHLLLNCGTQSGHCY